jgi:hypothetical protein
MVGDTKMRVCIVVPVTLVDKKLFDITLRFLDSIDKRTTYSNYDVLVYDSNSDLKLTRRLSQEIGNLKNKDKFKVKILTNYRFNISQIYNTSLKDSSADMFIMSNNDMEIINAEWLTNIVRWIENIPDIGICIPYHDFLGDPLNVMLNDTVEDHGRVSFAIYGITRKVIKDIGGFDERFDLYYHDHDVYSMVIKKGYKVLWAHNALVKHYGERTTINHPNIERHDYKRAHNLFLSKKY